MQLSSSPLPRDPALRLAMAMRLSRRLLMVLAVAGGTWVMPSRPAFGQAPGVTVEPVRSIEEIQKELNEAGQAMSEAVPSMEALYDPAQRDKAAVTALPAMRRLSRLLDEYVKAEPRSAIQIGRASMELKAWMAVLGDKAADDDIKRLTVSPEDEIATGGKAWSVLVRWVRARNEALSQEKLALELSELAKVRRDNPTIAQVAAVMTETAANATLAEQAEKIVSEDLKGPVAQQIAQTLAGKRKLKGLVNKPLVLQGAALDGSKFSTAGWKGKVVLVDFWATWCPPCRAELPEVKKVYAEFHAKGLEIVGVSCDRDVDDLKGFLSQNADMPWPQLFEPGKPGWHPLAEEFGIDGIPTMFLIDKKGVVRSVTARENYKELIPKLLAE
ncbi:TlpA family protein disulfide reductase [Humisphaera borealis]|uniref:TlpA family protein disulfide reductase n=1 Tax=Humisphaera borealis TaxID=2807512 RepID=A0A7M2WSZ0_9BACT|nr:TlpA disulfide reductase family protein [Humisphaera borealis]QOV88645.1 TlpA family protein disulfide reductase [Humisphaera borealis]